MAAGISDPQEKLSIKSLTRSELADFFLKIGEPDYRADQVMDWIYKKRVDSFSTMSNLPLKLREELKRDFELGELKVLKRQEAADRTVKFLFELRDHKKIESVLLRFADRRNTGCISTQVGCKMGCRLCATGGMGFIRNLSAAEIVEQIMNIEEECGVDLTNIVFMGMGEPLDNYDNLLKAMRIINAGWGLEKGVRRMTVSTCGLVPQIYRLADEGLQLGLAVSLNAPNDCLRNRVMPVNRRWPIKELLSACRAYFQRTNRRVTFEYVLLSDFNDRKEDAAELAKLLEEMNCHVNLIQFNPVPDSEFQPADAGKIMLFRDILMETGISVTVRLRRGEEIDAACGQLRS